MEVRSSDYNEDNFAEGEKKKKKKKKKKKSSKKKIQDTRLCLLRVEKEKKVKTARVFLYTNTSASQIFFAEKRDGRRFLFSREVSENKFFVSGIIFDDRLTNLHFLARAHTHI